MRISIEGGRATGVELEGGERLRSDIVVSNADMAWTYRHLVEPQHRRHWTDRRIDRGRYSMSLFVWYFGVKRTYPDVPHHMMLLGPRYKELLDDIFRKHKLADDFSLYLHRPTATDASMAPPGCDAFYALAPVPHLDSGTDWPAFAETYRSRIAELLIAPCCRVSRATSSLRASRRPRISRTASFRTRVRRSASSLCCCRAPGSGRTTAAKTYSIFISLAPGRIPGPVSRVY